MEDLTQLLTPTDLERLRAGYEASVLLDFKVRATSEVFPPLTHWAASIREAFFDSSDLAPRDRELCIITLLAHRAPDISLSTHVYAGLMEGLQPGEICQAIGLSGCYAGLPAYTAGIATTRRTMAVLKRMAAGPAHDSRTVLSTLVSELAGISI